MFTLETRFGNDGYTFWFKLLESLGKKEGHFYDCNEVGKFEYLCARARVSEALGNEILDLLAKLQAIDAELWRYRIIWVQHLVDNIADAYRKRKCPVPRRPSIPREKSACDGVSDAGNPADLHSADVSDVGNPQTKTKQTKVEDTTPPLPPADISNPPEQPVPPDEGCVGEQASPLGAVLLEFARYDPEAQKSLRDYWALIGEPKPRGLSPKAVSRMMQRWEQHPADLVIEAVELHLRKYQDKSEEYTDAIINRMARERAMGVVQPIADRRRRHKREAAAPTGENPWDDIRLYTRHLPTANEEGGTSCAGTA